MSDPMDNVKPLKGAVQFPAGIFSAAELQGREFPPIQWIVQKDRRRGTPRFDARPWVAVAYLLDERFLAAVISRPSLGVPANTLSVLLAALPKQITDARVTRRVMA